VHRVWWLRDGERLLSNATSGIIVSNQTLVLQGVSRLSSGRYCCEATNKEGTTKSTPFHLKVKFEPICGDGTGRKVLGAAKDEPLRVECRVSGANVFNQRRFKCLSRVASGIIFTLPVSSYEDIRKKAKKT
ncbi:hypothetical protein WA026_017548, partial [Henosepilachna vigintioctopunctata]